LLPFPTGTLPLESAEGTASSPNIDPRACHKSWTNPNYAAVGMPKASQKLTKVFSAYLQT